MALWWMWQWLQLAVLFLHTILLIYCSVCCLLSFLCRSKVFLTVILHIDFNSLHRSKYYTNYGTIFRNTLSVEVYYVWSGHLTEVECLYVTFSIHFWRLCHHHIVWTNYNLNYMISAILVLVAFCKVCGEFCVYCYVGILPLDSDSSGCASQCKACEFEIGKHFVMCYILNECILTHYVLRPSDYHAFVFIALIFLIQSFVLVFIKLTSFWTFLPTTVFFWWYYDEWRIAWQANKRCVNNCHRYK